ncbi:MAG TPA: GH3 auxin-responsive promoter family protein, partial [Allocoleopsis sp.]
MSELFATALSAYSSFARKSFIRKARQPLATQDRYLQQLLQIQQGTELGQQFGLGSIRTIEQFRQQVPIWSYQDYEPYTERVWQGEPNVLTADPVIYINLTSGSTGKQKKVPVTRRFHNSLGLANLYSAAFLMDSLKVHSAKLGRPLSPGRILSANSARIQGYTSAGIPYGPVTV